MNVVVSLAKGAATTVENIKPTWKLSSYHFLWLGQELAVSVFFSLSSEQPCVAFDYGEKYYICHYSGDQGEICVVKLKKRHYFTADILRCNKKGKLLHYNLCCQSQNISFKRKILTCPPNNSVSQWLITMQSKQEYDRHTLGTTDVSIQSCSRCSAPWRQNTVLSYCDNVVEMNQQLPNP